MKKPIACACAVLCIAVITLSGSTQEPAVNGIIFDPMQPSSPGPGKITGTGKFTVAKGYSLDNIQIRAVKPNGGQGGEKDCTRQGD